MISTWMWNKMATGSGVALATTDGTKSFLDSLVDLTLAQLRTVAGVLATSSVTYTSFGILSTRSTVSAYKRNTLQKVDTSGPTPWDPCASGNHTHVVFALLESGVLVRCMAMPCTWNRASISIDDPVGGHLLTNGQMPPVYDTVLPQLVIEPTQLNLSTAGSVTQPSVNPEPAQISLVTISTVTPTMG